MARIGVDYSHVCKAALELLEDKQPLTVDNVRIRLGGTGSKSTIAPLLKRWKAENLASAARAQTGLPPDLLQSVQRLYEAVQHRFHEDLAAAEITATARIDEVEAQNIVMQRQREECEGQRVQLQDELSNTAARLVAVHDELVAERITRAEHDLSYVSLQQRFDERASEVAHLREQIMQTRQQFDHFQAASQFRWEEERKRNETKLTDATRANQELREELHHAQSDALTKDVRLEQMTMAHEKLSRELQQVREAFDEVRRENERTEQLAGSLQLQITQSTESIAMLQHKHDSAIARMSEAEMRVAVSQSKEAMLEACVAAAEQRVQVVLKEQVTKLRQHAELEVELRYCQRELQKLTKR
jgi:hypothetical protein